MQAPIRDSNYPRLQATNDRLSAQLQSLESNLTSLQSHLAEAERKRQDLENERDDLASRGSAEARRLAARVLVVRAEVLATERPRYGANYLLQPIFRDFGEIMESCSEPGSRVVEAARELAESAAIFDGVLGSGDASIDEESAAVTQLARRAEEFALSAPEALRELAGRYVRKLNEIAPGAAVAWAARSASLALLVDLYAKFEADPVGEAICGFPLRSLACLSFDIRFPQHDRYNTRTRNSKRTIR